MELKRWFSVLVIAVVVLAVKVDAIVLAAWDVADVDVDDGIGIETNTFPFVFPATTNGSDLVSASLFLGAGVNPSTSADQYGFKIPSTEQTTNLADAVTAGHYIEFSICVGDGWAINLESVELNGGGSSRACSNVVLMTSIDGFEPGLEIASAYPANNTGGFDTDENGFGAPIDLSAARYQDLSGTIQFRLYGWNSTSGSSPTYIRDLSGYDLIVLGNVDGLDPFPQVPRLSMVHTNGVSFVEVVFEDGSSSGRFALECASELSESNVWQVVCPGIGTATNIDVDPLLTSGFYRIRKE